MDASLAGATATAQWANSATLSPGSAIVKNEWKGFCVTPAWTTFMGWMWVVVKLVNVMLQGRFREPCATRGRGNVRVNQISGEGAATSAWMATTECRKVTPSSVCHVTARRQGQWMALCFVTRRQDSVLAKPVWLAFSAVSVCCRRTTSAWAMPAAASPVPVMVWARWQEQSVTTFLGSVSACLSARGEGVMSVNQVRKLEDLM